MTAPTKSAIVDFVGRVTAQGGPDFVPPEARIAVFDNDGTLWCEKPVYIQLDFLVRRLAEQAAADASLRDKQPYQAAAVGDLSWFGRRHHQALQRRRLGRESPCRGDSFGLPGTHRRGTRAARSTRSSPTPRTRRLNRPYTACGYVPMVELLRYLEANGFTNYIVSGGGRDFMRPVVAGDVRYTAGTRDRQLGGLGLQGRSTADDVAAGVPR